MEEQTTTAAPTGQKNSKTRVIIAVVLIVLLAAGGGLIWYLTRDTEEDVITRDLSSGLLPGSKESDFTGMNEGSIRIQINSRPVFEDGESEGNLYIGNPDTNNYDMEVLISLTETEEEIYNSGLIPPGYYIDNDKLDTVLPEGEHAALAVITYYTEGGAVQSKTNVKLTIVVENEL